MLDASSRTILGQLLRRESLSLLSYMADAFPWTSARSAASLDTLRSLIGHEKESIAAIGQFLVRSKATPPAIGSFPSNFTTFNFVSLAHLIPRLIAGQKELIAQLEQDLTQLNPDDSSPARSLLVVKKQTLAGLEALSLS